MSERQDIWAGLSDVWTMLGVNENFRDPHLRSSILSRGSRNWSYMRRKAASWLPDLRLSTRVLALPCLFKAESMKTRGSNSCRWFRLPDLHILSSMFDREHELSITSFSIFCAITSLVIEM